MSDFADLEAFLAASVESHAAIKAAKEAKARLLKGGGDATQVAEDAARVRAWEAKHEWRAEANCAIFMEQECEGCGDFQYFLQGTFERQEHRHVKGTRRWEPVEGSKAGLDSEVMIQTRLVPFCGECCERAGFSFSRSYYEGTDPAALEGLAEPVEVEEVEVEETPWPFEEVEAA